MVTERWVDGPTASQQDWDKIDELLASRGWMSLNRYTSRVRLAEDEGKIVGLSVVQHIPTLGPLWVAPSHRGSGLAERLADDTMGFMGEIEARGWIAIVESPYSGKLCEAHGMEKLPYPVYVSKGGVPGEEH